MAAPPTYGDLAGRVRALGQVVEQVDAGTT
jgi:hypothetical protein